MDFRQQEGRIAEAILTEHFLRLGYYVFVPLAAFGPMDLVIINPETGEVVLLDAKKDKKRVKGWKGRSPNLRIHRLRTSMQKKLGVRMAYVDIDDRTVHIVPSLDKPCPPEPDAE
tara:strand:- start:830 stop:1174 length:345 start_codon:yes stop_codon:yes gene_type:complete